MTLKIAFLTTLLSAAALPTFAQTLGLSAGSYEWQSPWGCSTLSLGNSFGYTFDNGCDGTVDYTAGSVTIDGNRILIDDAYLIVTASGPDRIIGTFVFNGENPAEFIRK